ncbi:MAG: response regulator transcription factor [Burkholderiaceae bacterium]|nr:response regulator transcription factor [Burkholderiaceae bacterium]
MLSTETMTRPAMGSALQPRPWMRRSEAGFMRQPGLPANVLLIEDTPDIRELIRFMLETSGMQVLTAGDGRHAIEMIENWPAPDAVVLDRMLPFVSGDELITRIRDDAIWHEVPIVVVSAKARGDDVAAAMRLGADDYVVKPFNPIRLVEVVQGFLQ